MASIEVEWNDTDVEMRLAAAHLVELAHKAEYLTDQHGDYPQRIVLVLDYEEVEGEMPRPRCIGLMTTLAR